MHIDIVHPEEDLYGNKKENIFLALDENKRILGSAYAYPAFNFHQTYETPYLIMVDVSTADLIVEAIRDVVWQKLFDHVYIRAKALRMLRPDLNARIYAGFEYNEEKNNFFIRNGFAESYSIIMEANIPASFTYTLPGNITVEELNLETEKEFADYKAVYDEIFITPIDKDTYYQQTGQKHFKNLSFSMDGKIVGGCIVYEKDDFGYIEAIYVSPDKRGMGISKVIMSYLLTYFQSVKLDRTKLEVWDLDRRAVELYKLFNYRETGKHFMFPGTTLLAN